MIYHDTVYQETLKAELATHDDGRVQNSSYISTYSSLIDSNQFNTIFNPRNVVVQWYLRG